MVDVVVLHDDLDELGGAESVCMHTVEALQSEYELTLVTETRPDLKAANEHYGTSVEDISIDTIDSACLTEKLSKIPGLSTVVSILDVPLNHRLMKGNFPSADVVISTRSNEVAVPQRTIQYIHYPWTWQNLQRDFGPLRLLTSVISDYDPSRLKNDRLLSNSEWTSERIESIFGVQSEVVAPPIRTAEFSGERSPSERENGFIAIGRVVRLKNVIRSIRILDEVRDRGHDVHLHIIGPQPDSEYVRQVRSLCRDRDWVSLEGKLSRDELVRMMETHRYGIHGHETEHFGISIAEMIAAGVLPFVPSGGGQQELIHGAEELSYEGRHDAVEKIDNVLSDESLEGELRDELPDVEREYGAPRFKERMRRVVSEELS